MNHTQHNSIVNLIWGIADDVLQDVYTQGKYRDTILFDLAKRDYRDRFEIVTNGILSAEDILARSVQQ